MRLPLFMPPPLGAGGIMFSGCPSVRRSVGPSVRPSVRSLKYPPVHGSVGRPDQPWPFYGMSVRPSVRRGFRAFFRRTYWGNGLKSYMLVCLDHLQNWLVYGHSLLIFLILALFRLSETGQTWGFRAFPENAWRKWPEILHTDVSWPPSELVSLGPLFVDFCNFGTILT